MFSPDFDTFEQKAKFGNLIPVYKEVLADMDTPVSAYLKIKEGDYSFLLESIEGGEKWARYSFLGCRPKIIITSQNGFAEITEGETSKKIEIKTGDPINILEDIMNSYHIVEDANLPRFFGGAVGYISYDMVRYFEDTIKDTGKSTLDLPDFIFMITDTILIFDNMTHKIKVVSHAHVKDNPQKAYDEAVENINRLIDKLKKRQPEAIQHSSSVINQDGNIKSNITKTEFEDAVKKAIHYIEKGDAIQVVLSQRFERDITADPFDIYRSLRIVNPSPYMYFFQLKSFQILGSSPEVLVRKEGDKIEVRPIAGTRKRGATQKEDLELASELLQDKKELAEHIMLVDLGRNDLGRVASTGSVKINELMVIEKYSHVMHIVSHVEGELDKKSSCYDLLRACFPAGTVSGAPKVRAMQIIEELETTKRGPYAGAAGYISFTGNLDTCINIRGIITKNKTAYIQAGAGIVADSIPENEYQESINKSKAMVKAIELAEKGL